MAIGVGAIDRGVAVAVLSVRAAALLLFAGDADAARFVRCAIAIVVDAIVANFTRRKLRTAALGPRRRCAVGVALLSAIGARAHEAKIRCTRPTGTHRSDRTRASIIDRAVAVFVDSVGADLRRHHGDHSRVECAWRIKTWCIQPGRVCHARIPMYARIDGTTERSWARREAERDHKKYPTGSLCLSRVLHNPLWQIEVSSSHGCATFEAISHRPRVVPFSP